MPVLAARSLSTHLPLCQTPTVSGDDSLTVTQVKPLAAPFSGFTLPSITACISSVQTPGPAIPSTSSPSRSSKDISAPSTSTSFSPCHSSFRPDGVLLQRGAKWPFGVSVVAAATCASGVFATTSPVPWEASAVEPSDWTTPYFSGSSTFRSVASGAPKPAGTNFSVWAFGCDHLPSTSGESFGSSSPRIFFTFFEKVSSSGVEAEVGGPAGG